MATEIAAQAQRVTRAANFRIQDEVTTVFPLFGPVREKEWAAGWNPEIIYSNSEMELHMLFKTQGQHADELENLWAVTQYEPDLYRIEYTVSTVNRVWFITVQCTPVGRETNVEVIYSYTGLNEAGNLRNQEMLNRMFKYNLKDWEEAIHYYLRTGTILQ